MDSSNLPLISVIIPCYNHGEYLTEAVDSIRSQDYSPVEIIVVDDGSTDNTADVSRELDVKYIKQDNAGLSAARNTGIHQSRGELLVFLDADDWLLPDALKINSKILLQNPELAFAAGAHEKVFVNKGETREIVKNAGGDCYLRLLEGNFIGMHATVMYRHWVFDKFLFDISLHFCEDYDLLLKVSRDHQATYHTKKIAAYRLHDENMSNDIPKMLEAARTVLKRQANHVSTKAEKRAFKKGMEFWVNYYTRQLYKEIQSNRKPLSLYNFFPFIRYKPSLAIKLFSTKIKGAIPIGK